MHQRLLAVILLAGLAVFPARARAETADELLRRAQAALKRGQREEALTLAGKAIGLAPKDPQAYLLRGIIQASRDRHAEAVADLERALALGARLPEAYNLLGTEEFKLGHAEKSVRAFDKFVELRPEEAPGHWMRGISYYYAGRFADGRKQFESSGRLDPNDVENAVWQFLCNVRLVGVAKARADMLKLGKDPRVPMAQIYALFAGQGRPEDVLAAAEAGDPAPTRRKQQVFYARLYLGLYYEAMGKPERSREEMARAVDLHFGGYMGDVARVHQALRRGGEKPR